MAVYFSILYVRYRLGIVTKEMLALPKTRFMAIGVLEALGVALGMSAGGNPITLPFMLDFSGYIPMLYNNNSASINGWLNCTCL